MQAHHNGMKHFLGFQEPLRMPGENTCGMEVFCSSLPAWVSQGDIQKGCTSVHVKQREIPYTWRKICMQEREREILRSDEIRQPPTTKPRAGSVLEKVRCTQVLRNISRAALSLSSTPDVFYMNMPWDDHKLHWFIQASLDGSEQKPDSKQAGRCYLNRSPLPLFRTNCF